MKFSKKDCLLYLITDRRWSDDLLTDVELLLQNGVTCVQLRDKNLCDEDFLGIAKLYKQLCQKYRVPFIVNDRYAIAREVGASGVHLGQDDGDIAALRSELGKDFIIGASAHNVAEAKAAEAAGADYLGAGCLFPSGTKEDVTALTIPEFKAICQSVKIPVLGIGGLGLENIHHLRGSGLAGVALSSALLKQDEKAAHCVKLKSLLTTIVGKGD